MAGPRPTPAKAAVWTGPGGWKPVRVDEQDGALARIVAMLRERAAAAQAPPGGAPPEPRFFHMEVGPDGRVVRCDASPLSDPSPAEAGDAGAEGSEQAPPRG